MKFSEAKTSYVLLFGKKNNDAVRKNISKILVLNEYIICYQKSKLFHGFLDKAKMPESMSNPDKDIRGNWFNANISSPIKKENEKNVFSVEINGFEVKRRWFHDKTQIQQWVDEDKIYLPIKNGSPGTPRLKMFEDDFKNKTKTANNFILDCNTTDGRENLENVF